MSQSRMLKSLEILKKEVEQDEKERSANDDINMFEEAANRIIKDNLEVKIPLELTADKEKRYRENLKRVLTELNISENLHTIISDMQVNEINEIYRSLNNVDTTDPRYAELQDQKKIHYINYYESMGITVNMLARMSEKLMSDPITREIIQYVALKVALDHGKNHNHDLLAEIRKLCEDGFSSDSEDNDEQKPRVCRR